MLPVSGPLLAAPPIPRLGPGEPSSPRSAVLRRRYDFPLAHPRSLICFASRVSAILHSSCSPWRRSRMVGGPIRARAIGQPAARLLAHSHVDASGISQVPRRSVPCLCPGPRPRPDRRTLATTVSSMLPLLTRKQRLQRNVYIEATAGLKHLLSTLHGGCCHCPCKTRFRLAGWPLPGGS